MNERDLFRAIGDVDDDLVVGAKKTSGRWPLRIYLSGALAACVCVALLFVALRFPSADNATESFDELLHRQEAPYENSELSLEDSKGNQGDCLPDGTAGGSGNPSEFETSGLQGNAQQPTSYGNQPTEVPEDFRFIVTWADNSFDSETRLLTENGGLTYTLTLTEEEMAYAWHILSALSEQESDPEGDILLSYTAEGQTVELRFSQEPPSYASLLCDDLISIIEAAANRLR